MATTEAPVLVTWSDRYSVGIGRIDNEHKKLVTMLNELYAATLVHQEKGVIGNIVNNLASYTVSHFSTEEELMKKHRYAGFVQHKAEHDALVEKVKKLQQELKTGKAVVSKDVIVFLQQWLLGHILGSDKRYSGHLQAAGVK